MPVEKKLLLTIWIICILFPLFFTRSLYLGVLRGGQLILKLTRKHVEFTRSLLREIWHTQ